MNDDNTRMSLRAFARYRNVAPSYIHRLVRDGTLERDADGKIAVAVADRSLDELRAVASPGRIFANEQQRRKRRAAKAAPETTPAADPDDESVLDPVECDAALAQQPHANDEPEVDRPIGRMLAAWELRLGRSQADILMQTFAQLRAIVGADRDGLRLSVALGTCWGKLRALIDDERRRLADEIGALIADTPHK